MIKYLGSKRLLAPSLAEIARRLGARSAVDLFAGTTRVGQALRREGIRVVSNDTAANGDQERFSISSAAGQRTGNMLYALKVLCGFRVIEKMDRTAFEKAQSALNGSSRRAPDFGRRDDVNTGKWSKRGDFLPCVADYVRTGNH